MYAVVTTSPQHRIPGYSTISSTTTTAAPNVTAVSSARDVEDPADVGITYPCSLAIHEKEIQSQFDNS